MSIEVARDSYGIPHISAGSVFELAWAQGQVTAQDRTRQIELDRLNAVGRVAEVLGLSGAGIDVLTRQARLADLARRAFDAMDSESQEWFSCYVDGVRAGLGDSQYPGRWEPWTPLAVFAVHQFLFGSFPSKIWRAHVADTMGSDVAQAFVRSPQLGAGSNAWLISGDRTASGFPLIAGDPHRILESPGCYQQVRLSCDEFDVAGLTFPGVPGVQHFGHTGSAAWAITNAMADYQDLFVVDLGSDVLDHRIERVEVHGGGPIDFESQLTSVGPVIWTEEDGRALALATPAWHTADLGMDAILPLLRSKSLADVDAAMDLWVEPVNNVLIADSCGEVCYRIAGRVPVRDDRGKWTGWVDPPRESATDGVIVTANEWRGSASDLIGSEFAYPARRNRIGQLIGDNTAMTVADCEAIHRDVALPSARGLVEFLVACDVPEAQSWIEHLAAWDLVMDVDSQAPAIFGAVRQEFAHVLAAHPVWDKITRQRTDIFSPWWDLRQRIMAMLPQWVASEAPVGLDLRAAACEAWRRVAANPPGGTWGDDHMWFPGDVGPVRLPGDAETVFSTSAIAGTSAVARGPAARYIWDLGDRDASRWVVPLGACGDSQSPYHHDQLEHWLAGRTIGLAEQR